MTTLPLIDTMLMRYAAGSLNTAEALVIAAHVSINTESRKKVAHYEAMGGQIMQEVPPATVHQDCLSAILRRIEDCSPCADNAAYAFRNKQDDTTELPIPPAVLFLLEGHCNEKTLCWTEKSGFEVVDLSPCTPNPCKLKLFLLRLKPQQKTFTHSHSGTEITVVLAGSYSDESGHYKTGDITIINDSAFKHAPVAGDQGCLCLTLVSGPLNFF